MAAAGSEIRIEPQRHRDTEKSNRLSSLCLCASVVQFIRRNDVVHLLQVGAGSGGMPVLDMLARDARVTRVTLIEPDLYKPHNVVRHVFPPSGVGELKAVLAEQWL